jgi:hypothetical protein
MPVVIAVRAAFILLYISRSALFVRMLFEDVRDFAIERAA